MAVPQDELHVVYTVKHRKTHRYMVMVKIWLALYGKLVVTDAAPGRTVPCA